MLNTVAGKEKNTYLKISEDFYLIRALTSQVYVNESRNVFEDNEGSVLGDSTEFLVAEWLYQSFPEKRDFLQKSVPLWSYATV